MAEHDLVPAAQYLRMSTERQEYSLDNQAEALERFAQEHGLRIVKTYQDAGKSGLTVRERSGLKELLSDVLTGHAEFAAILVYDVSRWGRFQDLDEAAHYEFLCKAAGIPIHYAAEQFGSGNSMGEIVLKAIKRTMAAEYSRELGVRIFAGKRRLAALGFHQAGPPGYGLKRVMLSADGHAKQVLRRGESKSLTTDRIVLKPGSRSEVKWVKWIYEQAIKGRKPAEIVEDLNSRKVPWQDGKEWNLYSVRNILTNPKYAGVNLWGRTTQRLHTTTRPSPLKDWIVKHGAFPGVVDEKTFDRAQKALRNRTYYHSNAEIIKRLKRLLEKRGVISESIIARCRSVPAINVLRGRFGSISRVYELIGFHPPSIYAVRGASAHASDELRQRIVAEIETLFPGEAKRMKKGLHRETLMFRSQGALSLLLCRAYKEESGLRYWRLFTRPAERGLPTLIALLSTANNSVESYYLVPNIEAIRKLKLTPEDPWFRRGLRLDSLSQLGEGLKEVREWVPLGWIPRRSGAMAQLMGGPGQRTRVHDLERSGVPIRIPRNTLPVRGSAERDPAVVRNIIREHTWGGGANANTPLPKPLVNLGTRSKGDVIE